MAHAAVAPVRFTEETDDTIRDSAVFHQVFRNYTVTITFENDWHAFRSAVIVLFKVASIDLQQVEAWRPGRTAPITSRQDLCIYLLLHEVFRSTPYQHHVLDPANDGNGIRVWHALARALGGVTNIDIINQRVRDLKRVTRDQPNVATGATPEDGRGWEAKYFAARERLVKTGVALETLLDLHLLNDLLPCYGNIAESMRIDELEELSAKRVY